MNVVDFVTCTISANAPEYVFQITLSDLGVERLKYRNILGGWIRFPKTKEQFLNDLSEALALEIFKHFEAMDQE